MSSPVSHKIHKLQCVLKTVERCNLACTYCYYFFGGDESFKERPPVIKTDTVRQLADFLYQGAIEMKIDIVQVIFHGGEPMLQKLADFETSCAILRERFAGSNIRLELTIQTNGTLIKQGWIEAFEKFGVAVGISIDGPKEYNDKYRIDIKKRGSYDAVRDGFLKLHEAERNGAYRHTPGTLTVLNPEYDYAKIYHHLAEVLGVRRMSFLLPDASHDDNVTPQTVEQLGQRLCQIFDTWLGNPIAGVRNIDTVLDFFQKRAASAPVPEDTYSTQRDLGTQVIVVQSDGGVSVDDSLIPASAWRNALPKGNIAADTLAGHFGADFYQDIFAAQSTVPAACGDCCWKRLCRGGDIENRFSAQNGFENRSIYCGALQQYYTHVVRHLVGNGYPVAEVEAKLTGEEVSTC